MSEFETDIQIYGRPMKVELEGFTPMEVSALARKVTERMEELHKMTKIVDSSKLALITCLELMAELDKLQNENSSLKHVDERRLDAMVETLQSALG